MSREIDEAFAAQLESLRGMVVEVGIEPKETPSELLLQVFENNVHHLGERLQSLHRLAVEVAKGQSGTHAAFTAGMCVQAVFTARGLLHGALSAFQHALTCDESHDLPTHPTPQPNPN
jgi:hypothetical protein